ncbi:MAG: response regulator [Desulfobacteraceae bacterium]|nr:MAG: response regulator [Desulfobacteraceae bacterium]
MTTEAVIQINYTPGILVVDDEVRIREACRLVLEDCGYEVTLADNGAKGLELIREQHFDIILLDLMMPELSGFDVLAQIKAQHPDTVVIVITGYATLEHSVDAMKKGAFDFIPKPFTPEHLRVTIAKAIDYTRTLRDITDTRSRLRTLVNRISDGVMCTNHEHRVVLANPAFLRMIGCGAESVIGSCINDFMNIFRIREMINDALVLNDSCADELTEEIPVKGYGQSEELILNVRCAPFRDRSGRNIGVITVLHDITALKKIDRMKSEFVSMVSHEIRNPMNSVLMQIHVLLAGLAGDLTEQQREILTRAHLKIENLSRMTTELLDLARIESGLITLERESVSMSDLIRDQAAFQLPMAASASVEMVIDVPETLPPVLANRRNMEEVLSNLITNAIKYSPGGGLVTVSATVVNDYLCIRVKDTGMGISDEDQSRIFHRFYRVKDEKTRYINGTGLGLSIVKSIIESHQGQIKLESKKGAGSTFSVFLPILNG